MTVPLTRDALKPTAETLQLAGQIARTTTALGIGGAWTPGWLYAGAYPELRFLSLSPQASAAGGVVIEWSHDAGATVAAAEPAGTAAAAAWYDSGPLVRRALWVRPTYTNGGGAQAAFYAALQGFQQPGGSGGGGGGVPLVDATPFVTGAPRAPTAIADNLVHELTDAAGTGLTPGKGYAIQQIGGADLCVYIAAGAAPAVATVRRGFHVLNGLAWEFRAPKDQVGLRIWGVKAVDGTANMDVSCIPTDGGIGF